MAERAKRITLTQLNEWGFAAITDTGALQDQVFATTKADRYGNWVPVCGEFTHAVGVGDLGVVAHLAIEGGAGATALTWRAAKAYSYALYTGCLEAMRARAMDIGGTRYLGAGVTESCVAHIGPVRMAMTLTVVETGGKR